ncbi:NADP-dependent oxidoreductase [Brevundimonas sp.]|uniref:NADP-dependent oxidoreductase n=1 Tax=Brevundimonas sp. TaxID=1871086 RepID=UPI002899EA5F|nr:NADP-dependent oxidoreductase [Brevundimonas sp.]
MSRINRQWVLARRPKGQVRVEDFARCDAPVPVPDLAAGEILIRTEMFGFDPAQRGWMDDAPSYMPPMAIGEPVRGSAVARVVASTNPAYPEGALVRGLFSWQDYAVAARAGEAAPTLIPEGVTAQEALGVFGGASLTAWVGLKAVGRLAAGDTVLVSGAAGAVGSMAVQIARLNGARVIGIAGGPEKCRWLVEDYGAAAAIDYRHEDVAARLAVLAPDGIDLFFDNVGGETLEAGIAHIARFGRIVLCGAISGYNDEQPAPGPRNLWRLIAQRAEMRGFILLDHLATVATARSQLEAWLRAGGIRYRIDMQQGFEAIPETFLRLFSSASQGKQLLRLEAPDIGLE